MTLSATRLAMAAAVLAVAGCGQDGLTTGWERDGSPVSQEQLEVYRGEEHCDRASVTFLRIPWPPDGAGGTGEARQFVRDPDGELPPEYSAGLDLTAHPPDDAEPTGFRNSDGVELWFADSDNGETAYLVDESGDAEAWPRADPVVGCD